MIGTKKRAGRAVSLIAVTALTTSATFGFAGVALADDVINNLDSTVDAAAEAMPLNVGGSNGSTQLYIAPQNGDGKNGCNLTGATSLVLSVLSSNTAVATVSPSSVTFTSCGDTKILTVTPVSQGSSTVSVSQTSNTTAGTFNLAPATFNVNVAPPANTAPSISVAGVTGGASYNKGSVPSATCQVTDAEDGNSSFAATLSAVTGPFASDSIGSQTANCSYTDGGGLTASASETYSIVDPSAPVVGYVLSPSSPDGDNGWYTGNVSLTWSVSEPLSPNSVVKTGCVDQTITSDQAATDYSCSATSAGGAAAEQTVSIKRDGTAPLVSYDGVISGNVGANGWYTSAVTVNFTATDALSGPATASQTATTSGDGNAVTVASPAFTDAAGNTRAAGSASSPAFKIDTADPNAPTAALSPAPNGAGWNKDDVIVSFAANGDNGPSGVDTCTADVTVSSDTGSSGQTVSGACTDNAGNVSDETQVTVKLDKTAPAIGHTLSPSAPNSNGWYKTNVDVDFSCADVSGSGIDTCDGDTTLTEGAGQSVTGTATDVAGNTATDTVSGINIDKTAPSVALVGGPADDGSYYFGSVPAAPTCDGSDALSGLDICDITGGGTTVGAHSYTATATDKAGNTKAVTHNYTVLAWTTKGYYSPVDMGGVLNTVKGGSTVPLKFELFAGSTELTDDSAVLSFKTQKVNCTTVAGTEDAVEVVSTGGTSLRYDSTGGQFIQNWKTPTGAGSCHTATMTADDGSSITALFKIK